MKKAIVLEGGVILAVGQMAILERLVQEKKINLSEYEVFVGTSGGSLNALLLYMGLSPTEILDIWINTPKNKVMPRKKLWPFKRNNLLDQYIRENILKPKGYPVNLKTHDMCQYLVNKTREFYCVAYVLQYHKGLVFGTNAPAKNVEVASACKYGCSHPVIFDTNKFSLNGEILDLTDGGIIQNCPVGVIANRKDIDEVLCLSCTSKPQKLELKRFKSTVTVLKRIVSGITERNEYLSYSYGNTLWGENFNLYNSTVPEMDVFDMNNIQKVIDAVRIDSEATTPALESWLVRNLRSEFLCSVFI